MDGETEGRMEEQSALAPSAADIPKLVQYHMILSLSLSCVCFNTLCN